MSYYVTEGNALADSTVRGTGDGTMVAEPAAESTRRVVLACPACRSAEHLYTVEVGQVLTKAQFMPDQSEPMYDDEIGPIPLLDTLEWPADGPMLCRNCDHFDLRRADLIPVLRPTGLASTSPTPEPSGGGAP